uniref:ATP-dependent (S)-NAD(P)H-hydrate dehydratase n=1 Tax=Diabrotica virgifera virgifera TaxID=50390 RepID=A0A6P7GC00_DIAVI
MLRLGAQFKLNLNIIISLMLILSVLPKLVTRIGAVEVVTSRNLNKIMCDAGEQSISQRASRLAPPLTQDKHKGQAGRIGVFGGSLEYTGAPYFSSISALKIGADLAYVFSKKEAAPVIKSYSPELIVLPLLDGNIEAIEEWLPRLHVVLIGPGMGRMNSTFTLIEQVIQECRNRKKPLVIDADGLFLISLKPELLKDYPAPLVLTPNVMEFCKLTGEPCDSNSDKLERSKDILKLFGPNALILCKGHDDEILANGKVTKVVGGGSARRCGGQGDLLGGALSTFLHWALLKGEEPAVACFAAATLTRKCNERAFAKYGRSMTTTNMIAEIHSVFDEYFELK